MSSLGGLLSVLVILCVSSTAVAVLLAIVLVGHTRRVAELEHQLGGTRLDLTRQLRATEHYRMVAEHASDGLLIQSLAGVVLWASPSYCRIMGRPRNEIIGRNPLEFAFPPDRTPPREVIEAFRYDPKDPQFRGLQLHRNRRGDGTEFWNQVNVSIRKAPSGQDLAILVCRDVTDQVEDQARLQDLSQQLEYAATHDMLTGAANRSEVMRFCQEQLDRRGADPGRVGMLHLDLDRFKEINDTHGHSAGDRTLEHVADSIRKTLRGTDMVARLGGDEFIVVCPGVEALGDLRAIARSLCDAIGKPFTWQDLTLTCACSVGAALSEAGDRSTEDLMLRSDYALYEAKRTGRARIAGYDARLARRHQRENQLHHELRSAIEDGRLLRYFQPTIDHRRGTVFGFETLVRWRTSDGAAVEPGEFLPLARDLGLMSRLDMQSMAAALAMKERLDWAGHADLAISFNASSALLLHPDFMRDLVNGVEARNIAPAQVFIEVLEDTILGVRGEPSAEAAVIQQLRDAGFQVLLDDFGVGYAGLAHLSDIAVTGVKVDRSLIGLVGEDCASARIVAAIVDLCRDLDLEVVAEGVEDRAAADRLVEMGCTIQQGYWISRPMPEESVLDWLGDQPGQARSWRPALLPPTG